MERIYFDHIYKISLLNEKGFVEDSADSGLATLDGVSLRFLKMNGIDINSDGKVNREDIFALDDKEIKKLYYKYFWKRGKLPQICKATSGSDLIIPKQFFDIILNMGIKGGSKLLQKAISIEMKKLGFPELIIDGVIGTKTLMALRKVPNLKILNDTLVSERVLRYAEIVRIAPVKAKFLVGWIVRSFKYRIGVI